MTDILITDATVVTMDAERRVIERGAVAVTTRRPRSPRRPSKASTPAARLHLGWRPAACVSAPTVSLIIFSVPQVPMR